MTLGDMLRGVGEKVSGARYGSTDPHLLAISEASRLGFPQPGASTDEGEAQRYAATKLATDRFGAPLTLLMNPFHEAALSWFAEGEGRPSMKRLLAGYRGTFDALDEKQNERAATIRALLGSVMSGR